MSAVSVVVASHGRPLRLGALLDALRAQTAAGFEVVVVHDDGPRSLTQAVLDGHPLGPRSVSVAAGHGSAARMRNVGWRAVRGQLIAFTDDDCRPDPAWLDRLADAAGRHPGAVLQGRVVPDEAEAHLMRERFLVRTLMVQPPTRFGQTANIAYPRALLERLDGFHEGFRRPVGEDVDLLWRARAVGAPQVAVPGALVRHAVEPTTLRRRLGEAPRYGQLALAAQRNPAYRRAPEHPLGRFAKRQHAELLLGLAGLALAPRRPVALVATLPWLAGAGQRLRGYDGRRVRPLRRLAAWALIDAADLAALAAQSARQRTVFL